MANWTAPAPSYLLLLGNGTYDPRNRLGYGAFPDATPTYLQSGTYNDFHADNWYVAGPGSDLPLMAVGRIPAQTPSQVTAYVTKLLAYESGTRAPAATQAMTMAMVTDSDENGEGFAMTSSALGTSIRSMKRGMTTPGISRATLGSDAATQAAILSSFNNGPFGMTYVGHGAENMWAGPAVFTVNEANALTNSKLPFVMAFNCLNSYFYDADPTYQGLGEALVLNPNGGAIAFWGSTAMTTTAIQSRLALGFFGQFGQATNQAAHVVRYGDLILQAKVALGSTPSTQDTLRSYTLIGDPTTRVPAGAFAAASSGGGVGGGGNTSGSNDNGNKSSGGHGFFSCGSMNDRSGGGSGGGGSNGDGGAAAASEFMMLVMMVMATRKFAYAGSRGWG